MERLQKQGRSLKNFTYTDKDTADEIYSAINSTQFLGVSVRTHSKNDHPKSYVIVYFRVKWHSVLKVIE